MSVEVENFDKESILYELLEYVVRKQEPELIKCRKDAIILPSSGTIKNALLYLNIRYSAALPESISQHASLTLPWKFAVGDGGRLLAILQENFIEIRRLKDEYSSVIAKASVPKDAFPQWRKLSWSPDGSILALSSSNCQTLFYNSQGINICSTSSEFVSHNSDILEAGDAVASMIFKKPGVKDRSWDFEFIQVTFGGSLTSYLISSTNGCVKNHEFSFGSFYRNGINAISYSEKHSLFFVAGNSIYQPSVGLKSEAGLTAWRQLNDYPYYKLSTSSEDDKISSSTRFSFWSIVIPLLKSKSETIIFKMSLSPNKQTLACLHTDGTISLWAIPNLQLLQQWKLQEQPDYNFCNPLNSSKYRKYPPMISEFHPLDIAWWSDQALVIARYSGAISICSKENLRNLLGTSPEFLSGPTQIVESSAIRGVLCLDCELFVANSKRSDRGEEDNNQDNVESDKESNDSEPMTVMNYASNLFKSTLYIMTDMERFQPKRRKSKIFHRTYKILGLKSTTPEELYARKIENEQYDEALNLAKTYTLDPDLVYQTQWRKSQFSSSAIQENLGKVSKRCWVLQECVSRVPETFEAARELLNFGLSKTSLETLAEIEREEKEELEPLEENDFLEAEDPESALKNVRNTNVIIEKLEISKFTESIKNLIKYRRNLLKLMEMLQTYEILLESPANYDRDFYQNFRQMTPLENALKFAKDGNYRGVDVMFTYFGNKLMKHWLPIISFFPETLNPKNYLKLLPQCDVDGQLYLLDQKELRQNDWSEEKELNQIFPLSNDDEEHATLLVYKVNPWYSTFRNVPLTQDLLRDWYTHRCYEIEKNSRLVDNAKSLIEIGKAHNVSGLENLLTELETLEILVYKIGFENMSLVELDKLSDLEKIKLLMSRSDETNFVENVENVLLPFAKKKLVYLEKSFVQHLIRDYIMYLSKNRLNYIVDLFQHFSKDKNRELCDVLGDTIKLAIDCVYNCESPDMLADAKEMFEVFSKNVDERKCSQVPDDVFENLQKELNALELLNEYAVEIPLRQIKVSAINGEFVRNLLAQVCNTARTATPPADQNTWSQLLSDILDIQNYVFRNFEIDSCLEIYLEARLKSGFETTIKESKKYIETTNNESEPFFKVSYQTGVNLVLSACDEYFDTARSLTDSNMDLAKACLHLVEKENDRVKEELDLISSLQILDEFNLKVLPLEVKLTRDRLKLVEDCLNNRSDSYKSQQRLLTLAKHLRIDRNSRVREGKVLELVIQKALEAEDYNTCIANIQRMIDIGYQNAWMAALKFVRHENCNDLFFRRNCLWFVVDKGPNDLLEEIIKYSNSLEAEIIENNLEKWMSVKKEVIESDFEVIEDVPDSTMRKREIIPKIFDTSSKIVKSSTQSMINAVKNRDVWVGNLKSFLKGPEKFTFIEDIEEDGKEKRGFSQSFPCFYESLHSSARLSAFDTNYRKYSIPDDVDENFKFCQNLLRVQMLKESSSSGAETNDVNQLLIECARNTCDQDCLLSLSYLLSLRKDYVTNVENMFDNLSKTDLHKQFAAWYYSLQILKNKNYENLHLYDPLRVIAVAAKIAASEKEHNEVAKFLLDKLQEKQPNKIAKKNEIIEENADDEKISECELHDDVSAENDDWDKWDEDWDNFQDSETKTNEIPEKDQYENFEKMLASITNKDSFVEVKNLLKSSLQFRDSELVNAENNPVLRMVQKAVGVVDKNSENYEAEVLQEFQDLLKNEIVPEEILEKFVVAHAEEFSFQQKIYLKLLAGEGHYSEVVDILKSTFEKLCPVLLEELFFRNLTPCFAPNDTIYSNILEHVFNNRTILEIRKNIEILIEKLVQQRNIPHAIALLNQLERIPPSLSTYDTCFQLLLKSNK